MMGNYELKSNTLFHLHCKSDFRAGSDITPDLTVFYLENLYGCLPENGYCACSFGIWAAKDKSEVPLYFKICL